MSNGPAAEFRGEKKKAIKITVWKDAKGYRYVLTKSRKDKETDTWIESKITFFAEELSELTGIFDQANVFNGSVDEEPQGFEE